MATSSTTTTATTMDAQQAGERTLRTLIGSTESRTSRRRSGTCGGSAPPVGVKVLCHVRRQRSLLGAVRSYELFVETPEQAEPPRFLLCARKMRGTIGALYKISLERDEYASTSDAVVGRVRADAGHSHFVVTDNGRNPLRPLPTQPRRVVAAPATTELTSFPPSSDRPALPSQPPPSPAADLTERHELAAVLYDGNMRGVKGPRRITVLLPPLADTPWITRKSRQTEESLVQVYLDNPSAWRDRLLLLNNKVPHWNGETNSYVLNFHGRVTRPSVKNFQLTHPDDLDYVVLLFGRTGTDTFSMDFQYPLTYLQAFGIALSSFHGRLGSG